MLTWEKVREWCRGPDSQWRYTKWFWTALLATYYRRASTWELSKEAAELAKQHRAKPDYSVGNGVLYCLCHQEPRFLGSVGSATWDGDSSQAAWYHFPLVKAYLLCLIAGKGEEASQYLMEFAEWRHSLVEAFDLAWSIGDLVRAHELARQIVDDVPQRVYFFCREEDVDDFELLERARAQLIEEDRRCGSWQAYFCAAAKRDNNFLSRIPAELKPTFAA